MRLLCKLVLSTVFASPGLYSLAAVAATTAPQGFLGSPSGSRLYQLMAVRLGSSGASHAMQSAPAAQAKPPLPADVPMPDGPGKELTQRTCGTTCHSTDMFAKRRHDADGWSTIIDNMISNGLSASDDDLKAIRDYLVTHFGPDATSTPASPAGSAGGTTPATNAPPSSSH